MTTRPSKTLETFPNPAPERDYVVHIEVPEFTCLCPLTGQPDFATLVLDYIAGQAQRRAQGLKLYMWSFRDEGAFHEAVTNRILDDLVRALAPALRPPDREVVRARRHLHHGRRRASQARLEGGALRRPRPRRGRGKRRPRVSAA